MQNVSPQSQNEAMNSNKNNNNNKNKNNKNTTTNPKATTAMNPTSSATCCGIDLRVVELHNAVVVESALDLNLAAQLLDEGVAILLGPLRIDFVDFDCDDELVLKVVSLPDFTEAT
jgi:hypothetical protein